ASDRLVNLIEERFDIALRARDSGLADPGLVARRIASGRFVLVCSPAYAEGRPPIEEPGQLAALDTIGALAAGQEQTWALTAGDGRSTRVPVRPRLLCTDLALQYQAALGGVGVALLPLRVAWRGLDDGSLLRVAREWGTPEQAIHLVFVSRRGMLPSVRALIDYLVEQMPT